MRRTLRASLVGWNTNQQPRVTVSTVANISPSVLVLQEVGEEADVLHGKSQDLVFAQLLVRRVSGDEFAKLRERTVYILLPPALTAVCENATHNLRLASCWRGWKERKILI